MTRSERIRLAEKAGFSGADARSVHVERLVALVTEVAFAEGVDKALEKVQQFLREPK